MRQALGWVLVLIFGWLVSKSFYLGSGHSRNQNEDDQA